MENSPLSFVVLRRVMPVSLEVTSTRALATGSFVGPVTLPMMMSVVAPTCAAAGSAAARMTTRRRSEKRATRMTSRCLWDGRRLRRWPRAVRSFGSNTLRRSGTVGGGRAVRGRATIRRRHGGDHDGVEHGIEHGTRGARADACDGADRRAAGTHRIDLRARALRIED